MSVGTLTRPEVDVSAGEAIPVINLNREVTMYSNDEHFYDAPSTDNPNDFDIKNASVSEVKDNPDPNYPELIRKYTLKTEITLRKNDGIEKPKLISCYEYDNQPRVRTGNNMFDALYALAHEEVRANSKESIRDKDFNNNNPIRASVFQSGESWTYVWTRDISYSVHLALASVDPIRAMKSLLFKVAPLKAWGTNLQIMQDTGSGGSYPISTDRVVWALAAYELLKHLEGRNRAEFLDSAYEAITNTIKHDRKTVFDNNDRLYRGEESFLDWREQSYPNWTGDDTLQIGISKALSTNILHYKILDIAAQLANEKGLDAERQRYSDWADELKQKINEKFYLGDLYGTMIFGDVCPITMKSYDLLGNALAVIFDIADKEKAHSVIAKYPHTNISAPVVFPQKKDQQTYHNKAVWPFATAYWVKAAAKVKNASVVDHGVKFLMTGAAINLSNMENFECFTGNNFDMPINSYSQLWSVAGYLALVQDVIFGLEVDQKGISFSPFITNEMCNLFSQSTDKKISLNNFNYRGKKINIEIKSLEPQGNKIGYFTIKEVKLKGKIKELGYIDWSELEDENNIEISLADFIESPKKINDDIAEHMSPKEPILDPISTTSNGNLLQLKFSAENNVTFSIYRNGKLVAENQTKTTWDDLESNDFKNNTYFYAVQAVNAMGNVSFPSRTEWFKIENNLTIIEVGKDKKKNLIDGDRFLKDDHCKGKGHYYEDWGGRLDTLELSGFEPKRSGNYKVSLYYGNGSGPINTGITCSIKKISIKEMDTGKIVKEGIVVMPQLGDWGQWKESSFLDVKLDSAKKYDIKIFDDIECKNMSFFTHYSIYTAGNGGGLEPYNNVNISQMRLLFVNDISS